jgi:hypothetical protein
MASAMLLVCVVASPDCDQAQELHLASTPTIKPSSTRPSTTRPTSEDPIIPILQKPTPLVKSQQDALRENSNVLSPESPITTSSDETITKPTRVTREPDASGSQDQASIVNSGWTASSEEESGSDEVDPALSYACACKVVRKVSLMGASDYCLSPNAAVGNKCGNVALGEKGECPTMGAQPCQDTGHVLTNNSMCLYDKRDDVYKCVASAEDLLIQKRGGKRRKRSGARNSTSTTSSALPAQERLGQLVLAIVGAIVGVVALV